MSLESLINVYYDQIIQNIFLGLDLEWKIIKLSRATIIIGIVLIAIGIAILINQRKIKKLLKELEEKNKPTE